MKIVHINFSSDTGGAAIAVKRLHELLCGENVDSNLVVCESNADVAKVNKINKTYEKIKNEIKKSISRNLKYVFKTKNKITHSLNIFPSNLVKIVNNLNPDIVNLHWIGNETISISDISKFKSKIVWTLHDMWPFCGAEHYTTSERYIEGYNEKNRPSDESGIDINKIIWKKKLKNYNKIESIICSSKWLFDCAKKSYLFKDKKIKEIPLILNDKFWKPYNKESARNFFGYSNNEKIILIGGSELIKNKRKGFERIEKIINSSTEENNFKFLFFGDSDKSKLKSSNPNLINLGYVKDEYSLKLIYSCADLVIIPSKQEAFGLVAYEAIHCGKPCLIFKDNGLSSIIDHKKNGYICETENKENIMKGISWCLENLINKEEEISNLAKMKFDKKQIIQSYLSFIKEN